MKTALWREGDKRSVYIILTQNGYKLCNKNHQFLAPVVLLTKNAFSFSFSNGLKDWDPSYTTSGPTMSVQWPASRNSEFCFCHSLFLAVKKQKVRLGGDSLVYSQAASYLPSPPCSWPWREVPNIHLYPQATRQGMCDEPIAQNWCERNAR